MRIRLKSNQYIEVLGKVHQFVAGEIVDIGKQDAKRLIRAGEAVPVSQSQETARLKRAPKPKPPPEPVSLPPMSDLLKSVRRFWFNNAGNSFELDGESITRQQIHTYGGPAPAFSGCEICQRDEWLSRVTQEYRFEGHSCETSVRADKIARKQGDDRFTQAHQNFYFAIGVDDDLRAPRGVYILSDRWYASWFMSGGSHVTLNKRRAMAQSCQYDVARLRDWDKIDWAKYDFAYMDNSRTMPLLRRPPIPLLMYGHDHWKGNPQETLDHYRPDVFITPFKTSWLTNMRFQDTPDVRLYAISASQFFTRPNLNRAQKEWGLLCTGAMSKGSDGPYGPRIALHQQIEALSSGHTVRHHHPAQFGYASIDIPLSRSFCILNEYSRLLGAARFVVFGACQGLAKDALLIKYYEVLGSGAVPIMPTVPDLAEIGVKEWVHYIPVSEVVGDNAKLCEILDDYDRHHRLARNAVAWHRRNADKLLFGGFEDAVRAVAGETYPRRVIS